MKYRKFDYWLIFWGWMAAICAIFIPLMYKIDEQVVALRMFGVCIFCIAIFVLSLVLLKE